MRWSLISTLAVLALTLTTTNGFALPCELLEGRRIQLELETQLQIGTIEALINDGLRAQRRRFFKEAVESYGTAIGKTELLRDRWSGLIQTLVTEVTKSNRMQGECTEILSRSIARAITLKDLLHDVYPRLGRVYSAIGNHPRAAREFAKAVQTRPNDSTLWRELGTAQLQSDQPAAAIESLDRSLILDPYQPQVLYDLARSHSRIEETDRAIHDLRHSISRGFSDFTVIERDDGFSRLRGDARFEEIVYHGPASVY